MTLPEDLSAPISLAVTIERKCADLPRYAVVAVSAIASWSLDGTALVEVMIDGTQVERRTIKQWDDVRWFLTITQKDCERTCRDTGDQITITLRRASDALPAELDRLLREDERAAKRWNQLSASQQRVIREHVAAARRAETRLRRAHRSLLSSC